MIPAEVIGDLHSLEYMMEWAEVERLGDLATKVPSSLEIVELGSWKGGSSRFLAAGSQYGGGAHITCIDIWPWEPDRQAFMDTMDWSRVTPLRGRSTEIAKMWMKPIGLLFIDAAHDYRSVKADYRAWSGLVADGGWLAFHDSDRDNPYGIVGPRRLIDEEVEPSGLWTDVSMTNSLWTGRRA